MQVFIALCVNLLRTLIEKSKNIDSTCKAVLAMKDEPQHWLHFACNI